MLCRDGAKRGGEFLEGVQPRKLVSWGSHGGRRGCRADLLALSQARLLSLSDEATVRQAQAYVDRGRAVVVQEQDGVVTGEFPNGTATRFPPGVRLEHSECSCDAEGVCIHRVITVLSYQAQHVHGESAHPPG